MWMRCSSISQKKKCVEESAQLKTWKGCVLCSHLVRMMAIACRQFLRTCVSLLCVMLSDSNVKRIYCKLLSFSMLSCVLENCNCRMNTPGTNMSDDSEVADRSKSYSDSVCTGDFINWSVERNVVADVPGHSTKRPAKWKRIIISSAIDDEQRPHRVPHNNNYHGRHHVQCDRKRKK